MSSKPGGGRLFVVTTRSRLHGPWLFPAMMLATSRVRRQLALDPTVVRWASVVAGPCEFWTITVWRSRHDMAEFMRSGAHEEIMWLFSRLLRSFWLMRWRPGAAEVGNWKGVCFSRPDADEPSRPPVDERLRQALEHLPLLRAATGSDGAACYDATAFARRRQAEVGDASGVVIYVKAPVRGLLPAWLTMRKLRSVAQGADGFVRVTFGVGHLGELYMLAVWNDRQAASELLASDIVTKLDNRYECWANEWLPENEVGNWDGARLRRMRRRQAIRVPEEAMAAAGSDDRGRHAPLQEFRANTGDGSPGDVRRRGWVLPLARHPRGLRPGPAPSLRPGS